MNTRYNPLFPTEPVRVRAVHIGGTVKHIDFLGVALGRAYVKWPMDTALLVRMRDGQLFRKSCRNWKIHSEDMEIIRQAVEEDKKERKLLIEQQKKGLA